MIFRRRFLKRRRRRRHAVRTRTICDDLFTFPGQRPRLKHLNVDLPTKRRRFVVIPISCAGDDSRRSRRTYPGRVYHWAFHTPVCKLSTFIEQHETRTVKRNMQWSLVIVCLLLKLLVVRFSTAEQRAADQLRADEEAEDRTGAEPRGLKPESVLMGIAQSLIGGKKTAASDQSLSLNMSNLVLMLVLRGLIWGVSYMQGGGGKEARNAEDVTTAGGLTGDADIETDVMLFLGYLVADESGRYDCLNRVACERPDRAESYLRSAEIMWKTVKMLNGVVPLDAKYEKMLNRLEEAIEDGRTEGDCQAKYKCFAPVSASHIGLT